MGESISISLPADLKDELDQATAAEGISRSDLVCDALRTYLLARRFRALRAAMAPYAEAQGFFTDDDIFRLVSWGWCSTPQPRPVAMPSPKTISGPGPGRPGWSGSSAPEARHQGSRSFDPTVREALW